MPLSNESRLFIEGFIDDCLENALDIYETTEDHLMDLGIEPNLDKVICLISGMVIGGVLAVEREIKGSKKAYENLSEAKEILRRRAWELRNAFIAIKFR